MHALDAIDRKILSLLQSDSRMTMQELADKVGLSVSPCHRRVKLLETRGVITRYIATVDQKSLGLHVSVFISIKLARQKEEDLNRFAKAISKWDEVLECYLMTGNRDYLLRVVAADLSSYEAFLKNKLTRLDGIASIEFEFCIEPGEILDRAAGVMLGPLVRRPSVGYHPLLQCHVEIGRPYGANVRFGAISRHRVLFDHFVGQRQQSNRRRVLAARGYCFLCVDVTTPERLSCALPNSAFR